MNTAVPQFITSFLESKCPDVGPIGVDEDLVLTGVLNSMHFVELLYLIEAELHTEISLDEVTPDDFRTIASIRDRFFPETAAA
jgi:acyl carrier protein